MMKNRNVACIHCFKDKRLQQFIQENGTKSHCPWCGDRNTYVVPLEELGHLFRDVARIYDPVEDPDSLEGGNSIAFLLQEDWNIFNDRIETADLIDEMAISILEAGLHPKNDVDEPDYQGNFRRPGDRLEDNWHEKIEKIMTGSHAPIVDEKGEPSQGNLNSTLDQEENEVAFEDLGIDFQEGKILYRARIHEDRTRMERFDLHKIGAPPPERAKAGRANRRGEPVLYLASDEQTALSEVRAWKGAPIAIARVRIKRRPWIVNLKDYKPLDSPFFEEFLDWKIQLRGLFYRFGEELSRPVMPQEEEILYKPSQHLCDLIRQHSFDGVAYPSAMGHGFNVSIFDPDVIEILDKRYVRVKDVKYYCDNLKSHEPIYDETPYDHLLRTTEK